MNLSSACARCSTLRCAVQTSSGGILAYDEGMMPSPLPDSNNFSLLPIFGVNPVWENRYQLDTSLQLSF